MTQSMIRHFVRFTAGLAALLFLSAATFGAAFAQTTVDAVSPTSTLSTTNTSVTVPVNITRTDNTPVLGFSVDFTVSPELALPSGTASITLGGFLAASGASPNFQVINHGGGNYTADGVTLGTPCGSAALAGTLFNISVASSDPSGTGSITITSVILRDCSNATLSSSIGTAAAVSIDNTLPAVSVTSPNGLEFWVVGSTQNITWSASDAAGIATDGIDLEYSNNNGGAWVPIATNLANSGTYAWVVPDDASTTALVRVTARDVNGNSAQDQSDATFTIGYYVITVNQGADGVIAPSGPVNVVYDGTQAFTITPNAGYHTTDVLVDAVSQGVITSYTFNNVVANHTIAATFAQNALSIDNAAVNEADGTATFTVSLNAPVPAGQTVTVDYATANGTAVAPGDYTAITTTTLTFNPTESSKPVNVTINEDTIDEPAEDFAVNLSNPSGAAITTATGTGTITDNDNAPTVALSVSAATLLEDGTDSPATVTATLSNPTTTAITVDLGFSGTATLTDDYTRTGTQIVIPALSTTGTVDISAVQDLIDEADETVIVDVDAVSAGATEDGTQQVTVTILDDDNAPTLSIDNVSVAEGNAGTVNANFTVTLSATSGQTVTVNYATANGTAVAPGDYTAIGTTLLTFLPGETTKPVVVVANGDVTSEPDETFTVNLSAPVNAAIATGTGTGTILNDDALGDLAAVQQTTGNDSDGNTKIALTFTAPAGAAAIEVYRAGYGGYPEYDDNGGATPPAPGAYPPSSPWTLTGVTASGQSDEPAARDFYSYVVYTKNGGGVWSPPSNVTSGTLNYHLGDVSNGTPGQGDNLVNTLDISALGSSYGNTLGALDPVGYLDVGPTTDLSVSARPTTDNVINFEDLVMFAINHGVATVPQAGAKSAAASGMTNALVLHVPERVATGSDIEVELTATGNGLVQALSVRLAWDPAVVAPAGVTTGALIEEQNGIVLSAKPGTVDAALLGRNRVGLTGEGTLARVRFRVIAEGDPKFAIESVDARGGSNEAIDVAASTGVIPRPVPLITSLSGAVPNPSRGSATIVFGLAQGGSIEITLYSVDGRRVRTLARGFREAGEYRMDWDGRDDSGRSLAPGAYFVRMVTPSARFTRKLTFLR